jgi:hypothetical protein
MMPTSTPEQSGYLLLDSRSCSQPMSILTAFSVASLPQLGYKGGNWVEDYEKSTRMYGGIMTREHSVEFSLDD